LVSVVFSLRKDNFYESARVKPLRLFFSSTRVYLG